MNRHLKQAIYGSFYLIIIFLIFGGFYFEFFKSNPTCFDSKQNQNEEGIDCGGLCENICLPETIRQIIVTDAKILQLEDGNTTLFGEISNPNPDYAIKSFSYSFNIKKTNTTSSDQIISGNSFIYPNEKTYLIFPKAAREFLSGGKPEIILSNLEWAKKENFEKPNLLIKDYEIIETEEGIRIEGSIFNDTFSLIPGVKIFAIFRNQYQNTIGSSETVVDLEAKESISFAIFHPLIQDFKKELTFVNFSAPPNN